MDASHNPLLTMMTEPIFVVLGTRFLRDRAPVSIWPQVEQEHLYLVDRIAAGDADGAEDLMREHLNTLRTLYEQLDEQDGPDE